ncbi:lysine specific demethylase 8 [Schistosoma japonicum]|uniref:Lysine specific demethylase 8 n=1 Tax=Schistosoma japonicum TaxID=6182 RepID=A0A4Z2DRJ8_SCHJA|nr:lysine specific demethylase 8 [Schistosoma japonicum]KAH8866652.1 lysine specific demethylase 8 [Schistosoma japonicum]KAH8866653.1 lysine specific demethylase 8 [Schistosoma japonicum]KAH8866654.1 lysine specific demethylase 8 [Schistosoma japonicum]KAH8866657.1 lysine specific demethylase 8 [Schistosoma japonicum]
MEYLFPESTQCSSAVHSSIIFYNRGSSESISSIITTILLNIANEAAARQLRTVVIRKEAILKYDFVHIHGCSRLVTSDWDNVHFVYLPSEDALINWFSRVHMGQGFADLIIVEGLDQFVENDNDSSYIIRLTHLLEDTRQFIHSFTKKTEHGHHCKLIVSAGLKDSCVIRKSGFTQFRDALPAHALINTYLLQEDSGCNSFEFYSVENNWKLNLKRQYGEIFWTMDH